MNELDILQYVDKAGGSANWVSMLNSCPKSKINETSALLSKLEKRRFVSVSSQPSTTVSLLEAGYSRLDDLRRTQKHDRGELVRWFVTTVIALAAFIKSFWL